MQDHEAARWDSAREKVITRWREILDRIEARDEGGVLGLANVIDEFCEEAMHSRADAMEGHAPPDPGLLKCSPHARPIGTRCLFCRGFQEAGGCFGILGSLNKLVLEGKWEDAREVAEEYLGRLQTMTFPEGPVSVVH
jgi:hypothetical protein